MALTSTHSSLRNREQKKRPDDAPQERPVAMDVDERRVSRKRDIPSKTSAPAMALGLFFYGWPLNGQPGSGHHRLAAARSLSSSDRVAVASPWISSVLERLSHPSAASRCLCIHCQAAVRPTPIGTAGGVKLLGACACHWRIRKQNARPQPSTPDELGSSFVRGAEFDFSTLSRSP